MMTYNLKLPSHLFGDAIKSSLKISQDLWKEDRAKTPRTDNLDKSVHNGVLVSPTMLCLDRCPAYIQNPQSRRITSLLGRRF